MYTFKSKAIKTYFYMIYMYMYNFLIDPAQVNIQFILFHGRSSVKNAKFSYLHDSIAARIQNSVWLNIRVKEQWV